MLMSIDIILTMINLNVYRKYHPKDKVWYTMERNPLISRCLKKFGIWKGMIVGSFFTFSILTIILMIPMNVSNYYFIYGIYFTVIYLHFVILHTLVKQKGKFRRKF